MVPADNTDQPPAVTFAAPEKTEKPQLPRMFFHRKLSIIQMTLAASVFLFEIGALCSPAKLPLDSGIHCSALVFVLGLLSLFLAEMNSWSLFTMCMVTNFIVMMASIVGIGYESWTLDKHGVRQPNQSGTHERDHLGRVKAIVVLSFCIFELVVTSFTAWRFFASIPKISSQNGATPTTPQSAVYGPQQQT